MKQLTIDTILSTLFKGSITIRILLLVPELGHVKLRA